METQEKFQPTITGGSFLINQSPKRIFVNSDFTEEQNMMIASAKDFVEQEAMPLADELEKKKDLSQTINLLEKAGELGLLSLGVPENYGGIEVSFNTTLKVIEEVAKCTEFSPAFGVQTSIGIAPILLYGNEDQKAKYIPNLISGKWKGCYCLTEPDAGSDANSGKTKAVYDSNKKAYVLNGQKMWITNAGIADIFIVFAKVEDDKDLSAFVVEKSFEGLSLGDEEDKMGIRASSTRQVFLNDVAVPEANMLGKRGEGFKIALNVLSTGRIKLGIGGVGVSKKAICHSVEYAKQRKQFGKSISEFGAIKHKIAQMVTKTYALEAAAYRTGDYIDQKEAELLSTGVSKEQAKPKSVSAFGIECAIIKVFGTEVQDFVVDEGLQVYGGMGFSEEAPMARLYRDARISRIFEGTNEINRMLIVDMLLKKAMKGELDLMSAAQEVQSELTSVPSLTPDNETDEWAKAFSTIQNLKKAILAIAGSAAQKLMVKLKDEQEILMNIADMVIQLYVVESCWLRSQNKKDLLGEEAAQIELEISKLQLYDAIEEIKSAGQKAILSFAEGDDAKMLLMALKRFTKFNTFNLKESGRMIADKVIEEGEFCF
ncbi:acyl-CoA dehydrogenase family protein [Marivirga arenosa]|uniref:Acyl-CoA dehydrogenase family protein n=1 Tax=Marivirga arenosa TaxID=3059076 RepID=A0AA51N6W4_9BACT|nr:acyl-CoA dehydrogenase family protein [Marivirga sp. ABR2-2]WMN07049.1 acyl-CoA dehydrogenase family protein [Marivirga sp. ABR2-2]